MYATAAPAASPVAARATLGLTKIASRRFPPGDRRIDDEFSVRHFQDLTGLYGVPFRPDAAGRARGNTFTTMARNLIGALSAGEPAEPLPLAIVAHATPDVDCRLAAATYLSELPGAPLSFAVSEGGGCTPFTALRLAVEHCLRHGHRRAVVLVLDQASLPYDVPSELAPAGDAGVALLLTDDGAALGLGHVAGAGRSDTAGAVLAALAQALPDGLPDGDPVEVFTGPGIDPGRDLPAGIGTGVGTGIGTVSPAPPGFPCTGVWAGLAERFDTPAPRGARTILVDQDRATGDVSVCVIRREQR